MQNRLEKLQGGKNFPYHTPLKPPYRRLAYDYTDESWVPGARFNPQSNCKSGRRVQSRVHHLDWTPGLGSVSITLNLETKEIPQGGTKLHCDIEKGYCHPTALTKATIIWEPEVHCQIFEMIRFDAYVVKYQDRYWIETNKDWTLVQELSKQNKNNTNNNNTTQIATRIEVYTKPQFHCESTKPIYTTEYEDIFIIYEHGFDMNTGKPYDTNINTFENQKFIKINSKDVSRQHNNQNNTINP